ncbi:hypothetical protein [Solimonas marina]|nr:hypothetical protein [Solimonas marina]
METLDFLKEASRYRKQQSHENGTAACRARIGSLLANARLVLKAS